MNVDAEGELMLFGIPVVVAIVANFIFYAALFLVVKRACRALRGARYPALRRWGERRWTLTMIVSALAVLVPLALNLQRHRERANLSAADLALTAPLHGVRSVALLIQRPAEPNKKQDTTDLLGWCDAQFCSALLDDPTVEAVLVGSPPALGTALDPAQRLMVFRVENGRLVSEPARLGDADVVVLLQAVPAWAGHSTCVYPQLLGILNPPPAPSAREHWCYPSINLVAFGSRLSLYLREEQGWRLMSRETVLNGSNWFVPALIGPLNPFNLDIFVDGNPHFARIDFVGLPLIYSEFAPPTVDVRARLKEWGLLRLRG